MTPWEGRRPQEQNATASYLARVLRDYLGLERLAERAELGHFDDYFAPAEVADGMEMIRLVQALEQARREASPAMREKIEEVIAAVKEGEFDGTKEESDRWAQSKDGQDAMRDLLSGR